MLFQPFQVLSVRKVPGELISALPLTDCGVLCCGEGRGQVTLGARTLSFRHGICLFLYNAGIPALQFEGGSALPYWIELKINHVDLEKKLFGQALRLPCEASGISRACEISRGSYDTLDQLLEMLLMEQAARQLPDPVSPSGAVEYGEVDAPRLGKLFVALREYLDKNLQNDFTASQLAAAVGCSHRQLNNILQKHRGCTTLEFVNSYRIQKARLYLISSEQTITQIAAMTGFKSVHYFSRVFKKVTGLSPQAFRASFSQQDEQ